MKWIQPNVFLDMWMFAQNSDKDWREEITEEICFRNVYMRPLSPAVWRTLAVKWTASWILSLNWWLGDSARVLWRGFVSEADMKWICHSCCFFTLSFLKKCLKVAAENSRKRDHVDIWRYSSQAAKLHVAAPIYPPSPLQNYSFPSPPTSEGHYNAPHNGLLKPPHVCHMASLARHDWSTPRLGTKRRGEHLRNLHVNQV